MRSPAGVEPNLRSRTSQRRPVAGLAAARDYRTRSDTGGFEPDASHVNAADIPWDDIGGSGTSWTEEYRSRGGEALALSEVTRLKTLVGHMGKGIPDNGIKFGVMEIGPGAIYLHINILRQQSTISFLVAPRLSPVT